ncbi:hypothetical protein DSM106972_084090 [Dulcicalothrix desertica PCC 7102]|uniref:Uncharacterized protein n=1 Tax=Dulcicalothrix desertica PCC 7102 TaxID=232991 RepID=A0A3S1CSB5_9CYAN|nr:hypothetical protein [Dulcicalothrix desertica]RUS97461.1 hypothetical protein DSM106972_084090 [Dulcicalothrix desertica PCC 7102]TWH62061.1 hypothetical protein CAL7102_00755 [Dulcicalothrix desertica PCC 7102]
MAKKAVGAVRWNLKRLMDERDIGSTEFARVLKIDVSNVTRWRQAEYLPQINEKRWIQIVSAINYICESRGNYRMLIQLDDLVEFRYTEQRDFDVDYSSGDIRKKPASKQKSKQKDADGGEKSTIAA